MPKSENVSFYELSHGKNNSMQLSHAETLENIIEDRLYLVIYKERNGNNWEVCEADLSKLVRGRASFSESSGSLTRYINLLMTLEEFKSHKVIPLRECKGKFKGAMKLYFMYYSRVVIILFSTGLYKSAFSTYSFGKTRFSSFCVLVFRVSASFAFNFQFCSMF